MFQNYTYGNYGVHDAVYSLKTSEHVNYMQVEYGYFLSYLVALAFITHRN